MIKESHYQFRIGYLGRKVRGDIQMNLPVFYDMNNIILLLHYTTLYIIFILSIFTRDRKSYLPTHERNYYCMCVCVRARARVCPCVYARVTQTTTL